jgi:hypothetical protein
MVELDRLVVHQKQVNLRHVDRIKSELGASPDEQQIFDTCLPLDSDLPPWSVAPMVSGGYGVVSPSTDLRILGIDVLDPQTVAGSERRGRTIAAVTIFVGFTANALAVVSAEDRLLLNNGSHRAYALRELGFTHAPAVVMHVSRREELELITTPEVVANTDRFFADPRPPILRDYFDDQLRKLVGVPPRNRQVRVGWVTDTSDMPGIS